MTPGGAADWAGERAVAWASMADRLEAQIEPVSDLLFAGARRIARAMEMDGGFGAHGSFVAINNRVSQSVPHLHVHVIPRHRKDGLRGFFWPRQKYASEEEAATIAATLRTAVDKAG